MEKENWTDIYSSRRTTPEAIAAAIPGNARIFTTPSSNFALELVNAISDRSDLGTVHLYSGLGMTIPDFLSPEQKGRIHYHTVFMGPLERIVMEQGWLTPFSIHFSRLHELLTSIDYDAAILDVSPPDENGYMSLGPSGTLIGRDMLKRAKKVYCQVNAQTPYLFGNRVHIHVSEADLFCEVNRPCFELPAFETDTVEEKIAERIVPMIPDGATIQLGIGKLADAIGARLTDKQDLGIHTELLTPSMIRLYEMGTVTGKYKTLHPHKIIAAFAMGRARDYRFMHKNPDLEFHTSRYVNDPFIIGRHDNFVSVNNAMAVDLTGQVSSESIGFQQFSGTGGQLDFVRGARLSKGGKSILALKSVSGKGENRFSRIQVTLPPGTAVTTPRSDVQYIATEYGVVDLSNKSIPDRAAALISIAHPDFREKLERDASVAGLPLSNRNTTTPCTILQ